MVLKREIIMARLKELDEILRELGKYRDVTWETVDSDLGMRWIIERGLIAAASVVFDIADHILSGYFGYYAETYEQSLEALHGEGVLSAKAFRQIKGLGGFRNILIHRYLSIDPREVFANYKKGLGVFPEFAREILSWLEGLK
jgi:uncharacterized protein YutE (UPF0331/DUF86 family)